MSKIVIEQTVVGEIPVMTVAQESAAQQPTIFYMHGFTGCKEHALELGFRLARRGLIFIAFDAAHHGGRADGAFETLGDANNCVYPPASGLDMYLLMHRVIVHNGRDLETLMTHFTADPRVDAARFGGTGVSMGGFARFYAAATNARVQAAAPILGIPIFAERWADVVLEATTYAGWRDQMQRVAAQTAEHTAYMHIIDPSQRLADFYPRPLFMLNGDLDTDSPKVYALRLYRSLLPTYAGAPEQLRLKIYDGVRHEVTPAMMDDLVDWAAGYFL